MPPSVDDVAALFVRSGPGFVGTGCTRGPWHDGMSGGSVLSLLGHVLEDVPTLAQMSLSRLTVDIVRPVPQGVVVEVDADILREGKKIQVVELSVRVGTTVTTRARALRIRDRDLEGAAGLPASTTSDNPAARLPSPMELPGLEHHPGLAPFLLRGAEVRRSDEPIDGVYALWCRLRVPVVDGEPVRATSRAAFPLDITNLIGAMFDPTAVTCINPDVTGHLSRAPVGEWVALTGHSHFAPGIGHGVSVSTMSDEAGTFGVASTSQILDLL